MQLEVRNSLKKMMFIVDTINPYIVIISIIGLVLEYTGLANFSPLIRMNQGVDVYFLIEFLFRIVAYRKASEYFVKNYGWVDLLAAIPGIMVPIQALSGAMKGSNKLLGIVKLTRVGKFFKMIRILRFLRVFSFMKKMRSDSRYIQDRLMKIGVSTVLVVIVGLFFVDLMNYNNLVALEQEKLEAYISAEKASPDFKTKFMQKLHIFDIKAYQTGNKYYLIDTKESKDSETVIKDEINKSEFNMVLSSIDTIEINLEEFPYMTFLLNATMPRLFHNSIMLTLVLTLVVLLLLQLFYVGLILAKDVRVVQLLIDSIEADDYFLVSEEKRQVEEEYGTLEINDGDDEILSLRKVMGKISEKIEELDKREEDLDDMEQVLHMREETINNEKIEVEEAINKTADSIYDKLKASEESGDSGLDSSFGGIGGGLDIDSELSDLHSDMSNVDAEEMAREIAEQVINELREQLPSMVSEGGNDAVSDSEDSSFGTVKGNDDDYEAVIKETAKEVIIQLKEYWESEGAVEISKKIISNTINTLLPRIKKFLS